MLVHVWPSLSLGIQILTCGACLSQLEYSLSTSLVPNEGPVASSWLLHEIITVKQETLKKCPSIYLSLRGIGTYPDTNLV